MSGLEAKKPHRHRVCNAVFLNARGPICLGVIVSIQVQYQYIQ